MSCAAEGSRPQRVLRIDTLAAGGDGVGRDDTGRVVFVPYTAPGDRVRVALVEERERFARGEVVEQLEAGPGRVTPRCPVFGRCGGCAWQHLSYPTQCRAKETIVRDALERIAKLAPPPLRWYASPKPYGYRERARVEASAEGVGFRAEGSHEVVAVTACPVLLPEVDAALRELAGRAPVDGEWELAADVGGPARAERVGAGSRSEGRPRIVRVGRDLLELGAGVFAQANPSLVEPWVDTVAGATGRGARVLELFAGVGTLSLALARRAARLVAVESDPRACQHLHANLAAAGLHARVIQRAVEPRGLAAWLRRDRPEVVVLDPPRAGLGRRGSACLAESSAHTVVYAACDPAPWARDLRVLCDGGFRLERVAAFDFFPQSAHVETVAVLRRSPPPAG